MLIKIKNFTKLNPRNDSIRPVWFRFQNTMLQESEIYSLTDAEFRAWIYLLCEVSKKNGGDILINWEHLERVCKIDPRCMASCIEKLERYSIVSVTRTSPARAIDVRPLESAPFTTVHNITKQNILSGKPDVVNNLITLKTEEQSEQVEQAPQVDTNPALATEILKSFNNVSRRDFKLTSKKNIQPIVARLKEGFTKEDFQVVTDFKVREWKDDPVMHKFLRPETVFGNKFEGYLQAAKNEVSAEGWSKEAIDFIFSGPREPITDA